MKNTVVLIFGHIQCLYLMYGEVAWVLVSSRTKIQPQIILNPDYLSVSYDYDDIDNECKNLKSTKTKSKHLINFAFTHVYMMRYAKLTFKAATLQGKDHSLPSKQRNKCNLIFQVMRYIELQSFSCKSKDQVYDVVNYRHSSRRIHNEDSNFTETIDFSWLKLLSVNCYWH